MRVTPTTNPTCHPKASETQRLWAKIMFVFHSHLGTEEMTLHGPCEDGNNRHGT
jgi:hypothetical protein